MISIVITSFKEPETIGRAIEAVINQDIKENYELIVTAPDIETLLVAKEYQKENKRIRLLKDPGKGKSYAINLLIPKLQGRIIIFTDGDVYVSENSINEILKIFEDEKVGCVTARPIPQEDKSNQYGFWANFLFDAAHAIRKKLNENNEFLECSGYFWGFRNHVINKIPLNAAEDTVVPYIFWEKGYKISYAENAKVFVKNTNNWNDWLKQKMRTSKAHETLNNYVDLRKAKRIKTFFNESKGLVYLFSYPKSLREFYWMKKLVLARFYMWMKVFYDTKINNKQYTDAWERVESTK